MSFKPAISIKNLGKCYHIYDKPRDRLLQMLLRGRKQYFREFWALKSLDIEIHQGEVVGIIGRNGAGKSTLLQLVCGTLSPTFGEVSVRGRVAALLELGAGFNPEFSGRENVFLSAAVTGMSKAEINARYENIVEFSGIGNFIDQPVKTYSSGMYMRLAFSIAINVDPDILVIDEALSVGDGDFSRKSFDCIMALKEAGRTILFCSHSMYQVEAICNRVIWLDNGEAKVIGPPAEAIVAYNRFLDSGDDAPAGPGDAATTSASSGTASITRVKVAVDRVEGTELHVKSGESTVSVSVEFKSDPALPAPSVAVMFTDPAARPIASVGTKNDGLTLNRNADGSGRACVSFERIALLKGTYWVYAFLMCENAVHFYEYANMVAQLHVTQRGLELGVVALPHNWKG